MTSTPLKMNGWNLQIIHEKKGKWSSKPPWGHVPAVNLQGCRDIHKKCAGKNMINNQSWIPPSPQKKSRNYPPMIYGWTSFLLGWPFQANVKTSKFRIPLSFNKKNLPNLSKPTTTRKDKTTTLYPKRKMLSRNWNLGGGNSNIFWNFHPEIWGRWTQFDGCIFFEMGWFNHQLVVNFV